jgi:Ca2+-binding EF-hand superfamily protein
MQINTGSNPNPMFSAKSGAMRSLPQAVASAQRLADQTAGGAQPQQPAITQRSTQTVDANFIMQHWGSSNALADLNVDGIVDAQDLAMALHNASEGGAAGDNDSAAEWNSLTGGDLNGDGMVDAQDLAIRLNNDQNNAGGDGDGVLTETDFPENTKVFARFDADGNGLLERAELERGLSDEFGRFSKQFTSADPEAFAKRWLEAFTGTLPMPSYTMNRSALADFFRPPHQSAALNALPGFLSAQA